MVVTALVEVAARTSCASGRADPLANAAEGTDVTITGGAVTVTNWKLYSVTVEEAAKGEGGGLVGTGGTEAVIVTT